MPAKRKDLNIEGANLWYLVGLITSDGCLSSDGRHIDITSKEHAFLKRIKTVTGLKNRIGKKYGHNNSESFRIQFANRNFYDFLLSIGLTPNKSLTLGSIGVADEYFADFLRGLIDGDGCIRRWDHPSNHKEQWSLRIYSGSGCFLKWLQDGVEHLLKVRGKIHRETNTKWILKFGKMAAREIVKKCYYKGCFGLERKIKLSQLCRDSYRGWSRSKTTTCLSF